MLQLSLAALVTTALTGGSAFADPAPLRVASVKFGTLAWLLETIRAEGLDKKHGLDLEVIEIASNQASSIALYGGSADVVVSDWTWALKQRGMGEKLKFAPFSASLGAVMVPEQSPIKSLADLRGKRLGVAGSSVDKSWLLLRAYTKRTLGADIADVATPQYGAAPLLAEQIKDGRLDAVLNFWTFSARLEGSGFRRLISMSDVMRELGVAPQPALVGFVWKEGSEAVLGPQINALLAAATDANAILATSDSAWERLRPLIKATSDSEFLALKAGYLAGIPGPWSEADMQSAEKIMQLLVAGGDTELVGNGTRFDPELFHTPGT
ncbi:MAG: ABC transporter substrate-binding protein [Hyphomicrobium sp.]